jgi:magnesium chelatase subunit I
MTSQANHEPEEVKSGIRTLRELVEMVTGRSGSQPESLEDAGIAELLPYPFLALVGQYEMKLALLLSLINPSIGGVLLLGPRGTGKTTAVRSLLDLLPTTTRSACYYGCLPEDVEIGGIDAICPDCAKKYAEGQPLVKTDSVHLVELPLNARIDDVVGGIDDRAVVHEKLRLKRGILANADQNILYIDEVNLLSNEIVDCILDAAAQGLYTVRRGPISATYRARFTLIGSMNPEEGNLRPQILDRFGLRVIVQGLEDSNERLEAYQRVHTYNHSPRSLIRQYAQDTDLAREEILHARQLLPQVKLSEPVAKAGISMIQQLKIDSLRAEITLFEAARAYAASDSRTEVKYSDLRTVAPMSLRLRRSEFMIKYFQDRSKEELELNQTLDNDFE